MKKIIYMATIMALSTACHPKQDHEHDTHGHEHEATSIQLIAYSDDMELYAEADPFATGTGSEVLAHLTFLDDFAPLDSGSVSMHLKVGSQSRQAEGKFLQPGIYLFEIEPDVAGQATISFDVESNRGRYTIEVSGIVVYSDMHEAEHMAMHKAYDDPGGIVFTKEQSWKVDFATRNPVLSHFGQVIRTTALVRPAQSDMYSIVARTSGVADLSGDMLYEGTEVDAGQALFMIAASDFAGENSYVRYVEAKNNYEESRVNYERKKNLADDNIVTQSELMEARRDYETSKAVFENLRDNFDQGKQVVKSPVSGYVTQRYVQNGEYVEAGQKLLDVSQNRRLMLLADVEQKYATALENIETANIRLPGSQKTYSLEEWNGRLLSFGRVANTGNYMIPVRFEVENTIGLIPGSFIEMFIIATMENEELSVPNDAILEEQGKYYVMTQITPELFSKREVTTGPTDGRNTVIIGGLHAHERVVTVGAILLKLSQSSGALDAHAGHVH